MLARPDNSIVLDPVRANEGLAERYRRKLDALIKPMCADIAVTVRRLWRETTPHLARDASPAATLREGMAQLGRTWQRKFDEAAPDLARHFSYAAADRSDVALQHILRKAGISVRFRITKSVNDVVQASIGENVALIRSIPAEHFTTIEGAVMRAVAQGRSLHALSDTLEREYGVTRRRAETIARDQNNKATATVQRARQIELGITEAVWLHSAGGKTPRPSHVAYSGKRYDVREGALIDGQRIFPGELINCRCVSRAIVPGFG